MSDSDLVRARARLVRLLHLRHLGLDPAVKRFRSNEAGTAAALEATLGRRLERVLDSGGDWRAVAEGTVYDDCSPAPSAHFDLRSWWRALNDHLHRKQGVDVVTVDLRGRDLTRAQIGEVVAALNSLSEADRRRILVIIDAEEN